MTATVNVDVVGLLPLKKQLQLLQMAPTRRRRLVARVAKQVIKDSKKRVREQRDLHGTPYPARAKRRSRKMLSRLVKQLKVIQADGQSATAGFNSPVAGRIAYDQQHGKKTVVTASGFGGRSADSYNKPATRKQARALIDAGFKNKRPNGKGKKSPTIKHIVTNYTQGQAGSTLKKLREWAGEETKKRWITVLPARSFLGATGSEIQRYIEKIYDDMEQELKRHGTR